MSAHPLYSLLLRLSRCLPAPDPDALSPYQLAEDSALLVPIVTTNAHADALPGLRCSRLTEALAIVGFVTDGSVLRHRHDSGNTDGTDGLRQH